MQARSSGRSHSLRRRAVSSVGLFGAPSTASHTPLNVSASYYSPLVQTSADRQHQAEEDAGEGEEETVVGGKVDERVVCSRIVLFMLVRGCTTFNWQLDRFIGPCQTRPAQLPLHHTAVVTSETSS